MTSDQVAGKGAARRRARLLLVNQNMRAILTDSSPVAAGFSRRAGQEPDFRDTTGKYSPFRARIHQAPVARRSAGEAKR
jgi:hypothetical protein